MEIIKHEDEIFHITDVITKDEAEKVIKYLEFLSDSNNLKWNQISFYDSYAMGFWHTDPTLLNFGLPADYFLQLKLKIKNLCEEVLERDLDEVSYHAQKWIEGAFASFHSDNTDEDGNSTAFERSKYAAFMYLNEDFTGGILNFRDYDISITPKIGMLAVFSGGRGHEHEVTKVKTGTRYTIGSFWDNAGIVYTEEQKKIRAEELAKIRKDQEESYKEWAEGKEKGIVPDYVGKNGE
jgi:Rps23 Pro-64 3,4-dihydroxylase Tpa1-like proline 4-hydroxylase